jgi:hypothetical protein
MAERGHSLESIKASIEARKPDFDAFIGKTFCQLCLFSTESANYVMISLSCFWIKKRVQQNATSTNGIQLNKMKAC